VRELRNVIERAVILCQTAEVNAEHLLLTPTVSAMIHFEVPQPLEKARLDAEPAPGPRPANAAASELPREGESNAR